MNLDLATIERSGYGLMDMLAELGGIFTILFGVFRISVYCMNYHNFASQVAKQFYEIKSNNNGNDSDPDIGKTEKLRPSKFGNILELFVERIFPKKLLCRCCRLNRMQKANSEARKALFKEINIIEMIKLQRFFKLSIWELLP